MLMMVFAVGCKNPRVDTGDGDKSSQNDSVGLGSFNGHEYVDLGLPSGNLWATCNVGASLPEEYGGYYIMGNGINKFLYEYYEDNDIEKYFKCDELSNLVEVLDGLENIDWGNGWHIPRMEDFEELIANCRCERAEQNGVRGCLFVAPNGNKLFFPCAGYCYNGKLISSGEMNYYRISPLSYPNDAWIAGDNLGSGGFGAGGLNDCGLSVRPVCSVK